MDVIKACPVPVFPVDPVERPASVRSGEDIQPSVTLDGTVATVRGATRENTQDPAVGRFLENLSKLCGANSEVLKGVSVAVHHIKSNLSTIDGGLLFVVSDKKIGKVLSYHAEDGRCLLELRKKMTPAFIGISNMGGLALKYEVRQENGRDVYYFIVRDLPGEKTVWEIGEHRE